MQTVEKQKSGYFILTNLCIKGVSKQQFCKAKVLWKHLLLTNGISIGESAAFCGYLFVPLPYDLVYCSLDAHHAC